MVTREQVNHTVEEIMETPMDQDVKLLQLFTILDYQKEKLMEGK